MPRRAGRKTDLRPVFAGPPESFREAPFELAGNLAGFGLPCLCRQLPASAPLETTDALADHFALQIRVRIEGQGNCRIAFDHGAQLGQRPVQGIAAIGQQVRGHPGRKSAALRPRR